MFCLLHAMKFIALKRDASALKTKSDTIAASICQDALVFSGSTMAYANGAFSNAASALHQLRTPCFTLSIQGCHNIWKVSQTEDWRADDNPCSGIPGTVRPVKFFLFWHSQKEQCLKTYHLRAWANGWAQWYIRLTRQTHRNMKNAVCWRVRKIITGKKETCILYLRCFNRWGQTNFRPFSILWGLGDMPCEHQQPHFHGHSFKPCLDNNPQEVWLESQKFHLATPTVTAQPHSYWPVSVSVFSTDDSAAGASASEHTHTHLNITCMQECEPQVKDEDTPPWSSINADWNHTHAHTQPSCCVQRTVGGGGGVRGWKEKRPRFILSLQLSFFPYAPLCVTPFPD